jgi:serine/threonine protein kinase
VSLKPEMFGKFILLDKIAMGGMAEVYRAKAPGAEGIGKIIALKRILPQYTANHEFIEMFKGEAKIAVNLTQGNIAQIFEFGEEQSQFYLAMEFIDGRNLRQILSRCAKIQKALTIEQCVFIMAQVANGLDYAHRCTDKNTGNSLSIIHRDMSPQNIMLSFEGEVKIVDFGIAKAESKIENTRAGTLKGKFGYMSPEQAEGMDLDSRTDIFSTGIVLWELLSGERLFIANNEVNTIRKIRECQIPSLRKINPNIHEELERISQKALAKDRSLRYQTASDLYRDLSRFLYKVNPEFTQHELGVFLKTLFKEDILEDRKKVAEFAKINFPSQTNKDDKTMVVAIENTKTYTGTSIVAEILDAPKNLLPDEKVKKAEDLNFDFKADKVDLSRKVKAGAAQRQPLTSPSIRSGSQPSLTGTRPGTSSFGYGNTNANTGSYSLRHENNLTKWFPTLLIVAGVGLGGYYLIKHPEKIFGQTDRFLATSKTDKTDAAAPVVETARVYVHSVPAGAQLDVDGQAKGTTPAEIIIPINQKVNIGLRRDGYLTYTKDFIANRSPEDFGATLQKANFGYLDVEVQPATADIYINGQKLQEKSPLKRYPVPAGVNITVRAYNPYTNSSDQTTVMVKQDTVKPVHLFPRKAK